MHKKYSDERNNADRSIKQTKKCSIWDTMQNNIQMWETMQKYIQMWDTSNAGKYVGKDEKRN